MCKFIVQYKLPWIHRVQVGIEASSPEAAIKKADKHFHDGTLWDQTPEMPLISDELDEDGDAGVPLTFVVIEQVEAFPKPDHSVDLLVAKEAAFSCMRKLIAAYDAGQESGGSIDWSDLDEAYAVALKGAKALGIVDENGSLKPGITA